jgi:predicted ester cyclase
LDVNAKKVVKDMWASYGQGDLDETWEKYVDRGIIMHPPVGIKLDRDGWLAMEKSFWASFDDIEVKVLDQVGEGDMVASRWSLSGRQKAEFMGVRSRGRTAAVTGILIDRVRDGKTVEHWAELSLSQFLQVLGAE